MKSRTRVTFVVFACASALPAGSAAGADTTGWCGTLAGSPVILCEDFDDYCPDPPCDDTVGDDTPSQSLYLQAWTSDGCLKSDLTALSLATVAGDVIANSSPADNYGSSPPFAARQQGAGSYFNTANYQVNGTSHRRSLVPAVQALVPEMGSVNGTDASPLTLVFVLDMAGTDFESASANRYVELTDGSDRAASKVEVVNCPTGHVRPRVPRDDGFDHHAIAAGIFGVTDTDPCAPEPRPLTYRLSVYNGSQWFELQPGIGGATNSGLYVRKGINRVKLVIKSSVIEVSIECTHAGQPYTASAVVTRVYTGGFAAMHIGNGACVPSIRNDYVDDIALTGGVLEPPIPTGACCIPDQPCVENATPAGCSNRYIGTFAGAGVDCATAQCATPAGACCLADASCLQVNAAQCAEVEGFFHGEYTACATVNCCPIPYADADKDSDVDSNDFAALQRCITPSTAQPLAADCACFDRDADLDVDISDVEKFTLCGSGPGVRFDRQSPPAGCETF